VISVTFDVIHVAAAGVWIGGLLIVLIAGVPAMRRLVDGNRDAAVSALVNSFHPVALFCAPLVVVAGVGSSWVRLGTLSALWTTPYGQTLLWKVALFGVVASVGMYNAVRARRRLGAAEGTRHFRLTASIEVFFAALVIAATTVLVVTPVPTEMIP
jgi:putative copper export protein